MDNYNSIASGSMGAGTLPYLSPAQKDLTNFLALLQKNRGDLNIPPSFMKKLDQKDVKQTDFSELIKIMQNIQSVASQLGLKLKLDVKEQSGFLVRIFNEINDKQVTTIPLNVLLAQLKTKTVPD